MLLTLSYVYIRAGMCVERRGRLARCGRYAGLPVRTRCSPTQVPARNRRRRRSRRDSTSVTIGHGTAFAANSRPPVLYVTRHVPARRVECNWIRYLCASTDMRPRMFPVADHHKQLLAKPADRPAKRVSRMRFISLLKFKFYQLYDNVRPRDSPGWFFRPGLRIYLFEAEFDREPVLSRLRSV